MQIALHVQFADFHSILINHHTMHIMYPQQSIKMKEYESKNKNKNKNNRTRTKREERRKGAADSDQRPAASRPSMHKIRTRVHTCHASLIKLTRGMHTLLLLFTYIHRKHHAAASKCR